MMKWLKRKREPVDELRLTEQLLVSDVVHISKLRGPDYAALVLLTLWGRVSGATESLFREVLVAEHEGS